MNNDLISRRVALEIIKDHSYPVRYDNTSIEQGMTITGIEEALKEVPAVQPEQKIGHWIICSDGYYPYCSQCLNEPKNRIMTKYCGECGAKMKSEVTE